MHQQGIEGYHFLLQGIISLIGLTPSACILWMGWDTKKNSKNVENKETLCKTCIKNLQLHTKNLFK